MQPKTKANEAYEFLQNHQGLTNPDGLRFHRWLNQDVPSLLNTDPKSAYVLKSFAYILMGKPTQALSAMQNAEKLGDMNATQNIMNILHSMGRFDESSQIAKEILQQNPHALESVSLLLSHALLRLDIDEVYEAMQYYQGNNQQIMQKSQAYIQKINKRIDILNELDIPKNTVIDILKYIYVFLSDKYVGDHHLSFDCDYTEIGGYLEINVDLNNLSVDDCLHLQDGFLDVLIDSELNYRDYKNILVGFSSACTEFI
ncbi:hypothetical protein [Moraxella sp. Pampa]|uniref:tetratricopeptide repeat protein n=1 Tax=Moraxella sp. Pampa TaxID=3111978 RepID=UPI002B4023C8|nr:hypothetical protein [Moraxella sp. Pampa]